MKRKNNVLTTVGSLQLNDVFCKPKPESLEPSEKQYRIISTQKMSKRKHIYDVLAVCITGPGDLLKPKPFSKNEQVIFLHKMIAV